MVEVRRAFRAALDNIRLSWKDQSTHTPLGGAAVVPSAPSKKGKRGEVKSKWVWALLLSVLGAAVYGGTVLATPPSGLTNVPLARGIDVSNGTIPLQVGTDVAMSQITVIPGGSSGWHSHPGGAIIVVQQGTLTVYTSVGNQCQTATYSAGQAFIERPGEVDDVLNTGTIPYVLYVTFPRVPPGDSPRIDQPDPGTCQGL
jgi:quercetin dioxygenase-like cupin family protein